MNTGTVKWFNSVKGFGFIQPDQGGRDVFVHVSAVERSTLGQLSEGQKISYDVQRDNKTGRESAVDLKSA
jgi:CspA family cold shock protein